MLKNKNCETEIALLVITQSCGHWKVGQAQTVSWTLLVKQSGYDVVHTHLLEDDGLAGEAVERGVLVP